MRIASVSAVVPTYNDADRLAQALASILGQSCVPEEVIVCDDASTDHTREVVSVAAREFPATDVRYVPMEENSGSVAARNQGIREARGEWIAVCDSDDIWLPDKLAKQRAFITSWDQKPLSVLGGYGSNTNDRLQIVSLAAIGPTEQAQFESRQARFKLFYLLHSSVVFPRSAFDAVGGYSTEYGSLEDCHFFTRMSDIGVVLALADPLIYYRKRFGSKQVNMREDKLAEGRRFAVNRRRAGHGLPPLSAAAYREQLSSEPIRDRWKRRAREVGTYNYRVGTVSFANGKRLRGALRLVVAAVFDRSRLESGVRQALRYRRHVADEE